MNVQSPETKSERLALSHELERLREQTAIAHARLAQVLTDVGDAALRPTQRQLNDVMEVNQQLLISSLHAHQTAQAAELALENVMQSNAVDALTRLPSRLLLLDRLSQGISVARRNRSKLAVLYIDLDDFKRINDTLGHAAGDEVLKVTAHRLATLLRDEDMVSRHGGDEFVIVLPELSEVADAVHVADKVTADLRLPMTIGTHSLGLKASIGISVFPDDGEDADALLDCADAAMYAAKRMGLDTFIFHHEACARDSVQAAALSSASLSGRFAAISEAGQERHHAQLCEANEQLVLAALGAQNLQSAAELANRRQKDAFAVVAHELRNPLTPMRMAAGMMGSARPEELLKLKDLIEHEVMHMSQLVNDLLDVSHADVGKLRLQRAKVDVVDVVRHAADSSRAAMALRSQDFRLTLPSSGLEASADPTRLAQVVRNLLDNASKYTPKAGRISLQLSKVGTNIVMIIADNGIGIRAEALPDVFDPFVQDIHAVGFNGVGAGIGLMVVRELVEAHGGSVVAHSEGVGKGSRFVVTLPQMVEPMPHERASPASEGSIH